MVPVGLLSFLDFFYANRVRVPDVRFRLVSHYDQCGKEGVRTREHPHVTQCKQTLLFTAPVRAFNGIKQVRGVGAAGIAQWLEHRTRD